MAKLNENTVNIGTFGEKELSNLGMALQGLLTDGELYRLKADFRKKKRWQVTERRGVYPILEILP